MYVRCGRRSLINYVRDEWKKSRESCAGVFAGFRGRTYRRTTTGSATTRDRFVRDARIGGRRCYETCCEKNPKCSAIITARERSGREEESVDGCGSPIQRVLVGSVFPADTGGRSQVCNMVYPSGPRLF